MAGWKSMKVKTLVNGAEQEIDVVPMRDGHPEFEFEDGRVEPFNGPDAISKIKQAMSRAQSFQNELEAAKAKLAPWEEYDLTKVKEAFEIQKRLDEKQLIDAKDANAQRDLWTRQAQDNEEKLRAAHAIEIAKKDAVINQLGVGQNFQGCSYIGGEKPGDLIMTPSVAQAVFGQHFRVEDGNEVIGYFDPGKWTERIAASDKFGAPAPFLDALKQLVARHPDRERIVRGVGAQGTAQNGDGSAASSNTRTRAQIEAMSPDAQKAFFKAGGTAADA